VKNSTDGDVAENGTQSEWLEEVEPIGTPAKPHVGGEFPCPEVKWLSAEDEAACRHSTNVWRIAVGALKIVWRRIPVEARAVITTSHTPFFLCHKAATPGAGNFFACAGPSHVLVNATDVREENRKALIWGLAREYAHVYLRYILAVAQDPLVQSRSRSSSRMKMADAVAIAWGFGPELASLLRLGLTSEHWRAVHSECLIGDILNIFDVACERHAKQMDEIEQLKARTCAQLLKEKKYM
jgi:hypothetical protein